MRQDQRALRCILFGFLFIFIIFASLTPPTAAATQIDDSKVSLEIGDSYKWCVTYVHSNYTDVVNESDCYEITVTDIYAYIEPEEWGPDLAMNATVKEKDWTGQWTAGSYTNIPVFFLMKPRIFMPVKPTCSPL